MADTYLKYIKELPLAEHLLPLIGDKKEIKILDVGSGPYSVIGSYLDGVDVKIQHCDKQDFLAFWEKRKISPSIKVDVQNMEALTYDSYSFDIVHCLNALDHTKNAKKAVEEMIRVCKKDGFIYIKCWLNQLDTGYLHHWNVKEDGIVTNKKESFDLKDFGFNIKYTDNGGESRYNNIEAILHKK